jgi:hypothetical protein
VLAASIVMAMGYSETSVNFWQITWRNNSEDSHLQHQAVWCSGISLGLRLRVPFTNFSLVNS